MKHTEITFKDAAKIFATCDALHARFVDYNADDEKYNAGQYDEDIYNVIALRREKDAAARRFWDTFKRLRSLLPIDKSNEYERETYFDAVGHYYKISASYSCICRAAVEHANNIMY